MNPRLRWLDGLVKRFAEWRGFHVSQTPPAWVKRLGGWDTASGVDVNAETALEMTTVFACVRILAETVASLPLVVYRRLGGGKERAFNHPLYPVLHDLANEEMTAFDLRETLMGHVATWGNAYAEIEIDGGGRVRALWPLRPDRMRVKREDGTLKYIYRLPKPDAQGRTVVTLAPERVLHIHGLGFNGLTGYSPVQFARQAVGLGLAAEEFGARFFGDDARPGLVLEHPGKLGEDAEKNIRESWEEQHGGLKRSHRISILEEGLSLKEVGIPAEDAQFLQTRKFQRTEICALYRVPPHMVADLERATFANIEHQGIEFVIYTMLPWFRRWEQAISHKLLTSRERREHFAEFLVDGLLRGDIKSRYEAYSVGRQNGWLSANDVRRLENMNPIDGGDVYLVPLNMIPAGQAGLEPSLEGGRSVRQATSEERGRRSARVRHRLMLAYVKVYRDVAARVVRREVNDVRKAARKFFKRRDMQSFSLWLEEFYRDHVGFVTGQFTPLARSYGELVAAEAQGEIGEEEEMSPRLERFVTSYVDAYATRHATISDGRIRETMQAATDAGEDPVAALEADLETWEENRSAEISRWEPVRYGCAMAVTVYLAAGIVRLRWHAFDKSCPYCSDLDGTIVGIKQFFLPAGLDYQPEGAERPLHVSHNVGHPPAHDGCDCMVAAA